MNSIQIPVELVAGAGDSLDSYSQHVSAYFRLERECTQAIVEMLAQALADLSGPSIAATRLMAAVKQMAVLSKIADREGLKDTIESCLSELRHGEQNCFTVPEPAAEADWSGDNYIGVFRLQRAELVASRFGRAVVREMLDVVNRHLKQVLRPGDRVERWRDIALVAFITSNQGVYSVRAQFSKMVSNVRLQHINVGNRSALLSIGVDWTVLPHSGPPHPLPAEVEAFLAGDTQRVSWSGA